VLLVNNNLTEHKEFVACAAGVFVNSRSFTYFVYMSLTYSNTVNRSSTVVVVQLQSVSGTCAALKPCRQHCHAVVERSAL